MVFQFGPSYDFRPPPTEDGDEAVSSCTSPLHPPTPTPRVRAAQGCGAADTGERKGLKEEEAPNVKWQWEAKNDEDGSSPLDGVAGSW